MGSISQELILKQGSAASNVDARESGISEPIDLQRVECYLTESLWKRMLRRIFPDARRQARLPAPPLVAYLGTQHGSRPYKLGDISLTGFCLLTDERWMPGTEMPITLQAKDLPSSSGTDSFTVQATVVRCGEGGVGFSIVLCEEDSQAAYGNPLRVQWLTREDMEKYLHVLQGHSAFPSPAVVEPPPGRKVAGLRTKAALKSAFDTGR